MTASARILRLLSLLQAKKEWSGSELSERLDVGVRTVRRDVDRLRELGYVIEASAGPGGGYRLGAGTSTPPLLLDDEEAIAVALALNTAAASIAGPKDAALRALVKLDQLLPSRLRRKWNALHEVTLSISFGQTLVDPKTLTALAAACRDHVRVKFKYQDRAKQLTMREVEPMRLVHTGRVWYLAAWDNQRDDWRTFRVDRIDAKSEIKQGTSFVPRKAPEDFATFVARSISATPYKFRARVKLNETFEEAKKRLPRWIGVVEAGPGETCILTIGAETEESLMAMLVHMGSDFELLEPRELARPIRELAARLTRGVRGNKRAS